MRNQRSWRTKSRLKAVDNTVKISQVIGKKDANGLPFYPSFTNLTVVLMTEDRKVYETTKASADGNGNLTFLKRGLSDDDTETEVAGNKKAWSPGTYMYITAGASDLKSSQANDATITIQKNSTDVDSFTLNQSTDKTINITVPTSASDVGALASSTKYGASLNLSVNSSTYVITAQLKDQDGNNLGAAQTIDLPLESVVVSGSYDSDTKKVVLTLESGSTIEFSVADLVSGLQSEITSSNKLDADLVDDTNSTNKFVSSSDKSTWNGKQDALTLPSSPTQGHLVVWGANKKTFADGGAVPTGFNPGNSGSTGQVLKKTASGYEWANESGGGGGSGDVSGPSSSTDGDIVLFDGATGKAIKDSSTKLSDIVQTSGNQTINGTKTFGTSPVVPSKSTDVGNNATVIATEAQVYKKQDKISNSNKLNADLVDDTNSTNKFVTASEKSTWNGKQNAINNNNKLSADYVSNGTNNRMCIVSASAPSTPSEGDLWYDTTNDKLKTYDGSQWNECGGGGGGEGNTKTFYLSSTSDLTTAQAATDWYLAGKNPVVVYSNKAYTLYSKTSTKLTFVGGLEVGLSGSVHHIANSTLSFTLSSNTVTAVGTGYVPSSDYFLKTNYNYSTPYTPAYDGSPATKKYVDDNNHFGGFYEENDSLPAGQTTDNKVYIIYEDDGNNS